MLPVTAFFDQKAKAALSKSANRVADLRFFEHVLARLKAGEDLTRELAAFKKVDGKEAIKFKPIKKDIDIRKIENGEYTVEDILDKVDTTKTTKGQYILGTHEGNDVILKKGKFGIYISWGENSKNLKELGNRPIENITFDEVKKYLDDGNKNIREINSNMSIRKGPKGDYIFYKTTKMKKPKFFDLKNFNSDIKEDYKICDINILRSWIRENYDIS